MDYSKLGGITEQELVDYFGPLFWEVFKKNPFEVLCSVLRVGGLQDAGWDPLEESLEAFEDYNALLAAQTEPKKRWRLGLIESFGEFK